MYIHILRNKCVEQVVTEDAHKDALGECSKG